MGKSRSSQGSGSERMEKMAETEKEIKTWKQIWKLERKDI